MDGDDKLKSSKKTAIKNTYSLTQIILHWFVAALVIYQLVINADIKSWYKQYQIEGNILPQAFGTWAHIIVGLAIFFLMSFRLYLRFKTGTPSLPKSLSLPLAMLAHFSHYSLYLLLFAMPTTGFLGLYFKTTLLLNAHNVISYILVFLILFHICAAIFHEGVLGNKIFHKMFSPERFNSE